LNDLLAIGIHPTTFSYPYGDYNDRVVSVVKAAGFRGARSSKGGFNDTETESLLLKCIIVGPKTTIKGVKQAIDDAETDGTWLVLLFHRVDEAGNAISVRHEMLREIVEYLIKTNAHVVTTSEGVAAMQLKP